MEFTPALAPVVKIAAWIPVTEEILEDAPTLAGYINTRLAYMVDLREEAQILNGPAPART
jgi:HK97 family phage major capsid protein